MNEMHEILVSEPQDFFNVRLLDPKTSHLVSRLPVLHSKFLQEAFPLQVPREATNADLINLLQKRMPQIQALREETVVIAAEEYGVFAPETQALKIGAKLGSAFDQILLDLLRRNSPKSISWKAAGHHGSTALHNTIEEILETHQDFLDGNSGFLRSLQLIKQVVDTDDKKKLARLSKQLEMHAFQSYAEGKPTALFSLCQWYTNMESEDGNAAYNLLEPDLRIVLPFTPDARKAIGEVVDQEWQEIVALNQDLYAGKNIQRQPILSGVTVMNAGAQTLSFTSGEAFNGRGIFVVSNGFRTAKEIARVYQLLGEEAVPDISTQLNLVGYIGHELGHKARVMRKPKMYELGPDATMFLTNVSLLRKLDPSGKRRLVRDYVAVMCAEFAKQTLDNDDIYRISSAQILNALTASSVVHMEDGEHLVIHPENMDAAVKMYRDYHTALYINKDKHSAEYLASEALSAESQKVTDAVLSGVDPGLS